MLGDRIERLLEVTEFFRKHMKNILLFACKRFEGIKIPWRGRWEIAKRMKK